MSFEPYVVVKVPFPFTDGQAQKRRPALILSSREFGQQSGHSLMAMITSARHSSWPLDVAVTDLEAAGLPVPCVIRMKFFTLDHRLVISELGHLSPKDKRAFRAALRQVLGV